MDKYSYKDVIIDPEDPRVEIGAEYYYCDNPSTCLERANKEDVAHLAVLEKVYPNAIVHFFIDDAYSICIIRKKESSYAERQTKWIADNDVKKGDKVRVTRKADSYEDGWDNSWIQDMDKAVGNVYTVAEIIEDDIVLGGAGNFGYPYFVLEKVEQKYVPFDLSNEEDRAKLRGAWVKAKNDLDKHQNVCGVCSQFVYLSCQTEGCTPKDFLEKFVFIDGTPCGQEVEE